MSKRETYELVGAILLYSLLISLSAWLVVLAPDYPFPEDRFDWIETK